MRANETPTATPATAKRKRKTPEQKPCACAGFEIGTDTGTDGDPDVSIITTGCTATTARNFAMGHDSRLVALLIRAGVQGLDVRYGRASGVVTSTDPVSAAGQFSPALAGKVKAGIERAQAKTTAAKPPVEPEPEPVTPPKAKRTRRTAGTRTR